MAGYQQYRLIDLRNLSYERLGNNTVFWRVDEMNRMIREGLRILNVLTAFWRGGYDFGGTVQGQTWYVVPVQFTYLLRVVVNGRPLGDTTLWGLDYGHPGWESETGKPQLWAPVGFNQFVLWPQESQATAANSLVIEGVNPAPQPVADDEYVDLGREQLSILLDYIEHISQFKEGGSEFQSSMMRMQSFIKGAASLNAKLMESSKFKKWMGLGDDGDNPARVSKEKVGSR